MNYIDEAHARWRRDEHGITEMRKRIRSEAGMAESVLETLYFSQTPDERAKHETVYDNKIGFTQGDAPILTPLARKVLKGEALDRFERLSARVHCEKYASQYLGYLACGPTERWENDFRVF